MQIFLDHYKWNERRLDRCLEFIQEITDNEFIPSFFKNSVCRIDQLSDYLLKYQIETQTYELKDLIGRLGGFEDKLMFSKFQERYLRQPGIIQKKEADITFLRLLFEEIKLERQLDEQRFKVLKRWDYNVQVLFKKLSFGTNIVDQQKLKKFFIRIRQTITDDEIELLLKRIGRGDANIMTFEDFSQAIKTQRQRSQDKIEIPIMKISTVIKREPQHQSYMEKLRRRYKPLQTQQSVVIQKLDNKGCHTPRAKTPTATTRTTETKQARTRTRTPNQNTEPRSFTNESKELNTLMSVYLNQQRCLQNVMAQLEEVIILKSLISNDWQQEWSDLGVNTKNISKEFFLNILTYYDDRQPLQQKIKVSDLQSSVQIVANNLFELLSEQEQQLQKAKLQFLRDGTLNSLDRYFHKGYMDVLDVLQILEHSTTRSVSLQDAELMIAKFNKFDGKKTITRKALLNELT
ncbi:unnamed protein product [Paramecium primaurelia]|uniref:EF-hand domain-containing protein n=1 Tax=Paramecium primaurelia TaxID=5886 RepID=A0A8S1NIC1_PARPR|nr:unnamed protein product [Paramecium primaurelia]